MQRTIHEVLELRDLIVACDTVANQLRQAASTARDADVIQMLGAQERTFRHQCQQLHRFLTGAVVLDPGGAAVPETVGQQTGSAAALGYGPDAPADAVILMHPPVVNGQANRPVHPAEASGAPGYPPTGPGTYSYRPTTRPVYQAGERAGSSAAGQGAFPPMRGGSPDLQEHRGEQRPGAENHRREAGRPETAAAPASFAGAAGLSASVQRQPGDGREPVSVVEDVGTAPLEAGTAQVVRADRPELVGWEPGAGNNEGWQAAARRRTATARWEAAETFEAVRPVQGTGDAGRFGGVGSLSGTHPAGAVLGQPSAGLPAEPGLRDQGSRTAQAPFREEAGTGAAGRTSWTQAQAGAQLRAEREGGAAARAGGEGHPYATAASPEAAAFSRQRQNSPRLSFAQEWAPNVSSPAGVRTPSPTTGAGHGAADRSPAGGFGPQSGNAPWAGQGFAASAPSPAAGPFQSAAGVAAQDPDALAVASGLQSCKHMATRMVIAAAECADRHLRRALYQMAGQHLEMAGQQWEWLRRRGLYEAPPAAADLVSAVQNDLTRLAQALHVGPQGGVGAGASTGFGGMPTGFGASGQQAPSPGYGQGGGWTGPGPIF